MEKPRASEIIVTVKTQEKQKKIENEKENTFREETCPRTLQTQICYMNISFIIIFFNEMNCFPGTQKIMGTSCSITLERERMITRRRGTGEDRGGVGLCTAEVA